MKMKISFYLLFLILNLITISSCNRENKEFLPEKYQFSISNELESYDSKTKTYNRKYSQYDTVLKIDLSKEDLSKIDKAFRQANFLELPTEFKCANNSDLIFPSTETTITLYDSLNIEKTVKSTTHCSEKKEQKKSKQFDKLIDQLWEVIKNKEPIKKLKTSDIISL